MMMLAGLAALAVAACAGYYFGRRARVAPPSWRKRTGRVALGKLAISLAVVLAVRRIRRSFRPERIAPLALLRASVGR